MNLRKELIKEVQTAISASTYDLFSSRTAIESIAMFAEEKKNRQDIKSRLYAEIHVFSATAVNIGSKRKIIPSYHEDDKVEALTIIANCWKNCQSGGSYQVLAKEIQQRIIIDKQLADKLFAIEQASAQVPMLITQHKVNLKNSLSYATRWFFILIKLISYSHAN